jgi:hypothetical protein
MELMTAEACAYFEVISIKTCAKCIFARVIGRHDGYSRRNENVVTSTFLIDAYFINLLISFVRTLAFRKYVSIALYSTAFVLAIHWA